MASRVRPARHERIRPPPVAWHHTLRPAPSDAPDFKRPWWQAVRAMPRRRLVGTRSQPGRRWQCAWGMSLHGPSTSPACPRRQRSRRGELPRPVLPRCSTSSQPNGTQSPAEIRDPDQLLARCASNSDFMTASRNQVSSLGRWRRHSRRRPRFSQEHRRGFGLGMAEQVDQGSTNPSRRSIPRQRGTWPAASRSSFERRRGRDREPRPSDGTVQCLTRRTEQGNKTQPALRHPMRYDKMHESCRMMDA